MGGWVGGLDGCMDRSMDDGRIHPPTHPHSFQLVHSRTVARRSCLGKGTISPPPVPLSTHPPTQPNPSLTAPHSNRLALLHLPITHPPTLPNRLRNNEALPVQRHYSYHTHGLQPRDRLCLLPRRREMRGETGRGRWVGGWVGGWEELAHSLFLLLSPLLFVHPPTHLPTPQPPYKLVHVSLAPLFSPEECQAIIDECEEVVGERGWTTKRHFAYPTTDIPLKELPRTLGG